MFRIHSFILPLACFFGLSLGLPTQCPPVQGDFNITNFRLYPENTDWNCTSCKLYVGSDFNATVLVYDPYTGQSNTLTFDGISANKSFHVSGVRYGARANAVYISANSGAPFGTNGADLSGPNFLIKYDTASDSIVYKADMAPVLQDILDKTGHVVNGFQDMVADTLGNVYYIASYGNAIAKVTPSGEASLFNFTADPIIINGVQASGWNGILSVGNKIVLVDNLSGNIVTFDTTDTTPTPIVFKPSDLPSNLTLACDKFYAPPKYWGTVVLCSDVGFNGDIAISVLQTPDNWVSARYLGRFPKPQSDGGLPTASVQIAVSIHINEMYFFDAGDAAIPGNRSEFPFQEITSNVEKLVGDI